MWWQKEIQLSAKERGFHLITAEVLQQISELKLVKIGLLNIFIQHTSASLTINENTDYTVRQDFESFFNRAVPENEPYFQHDYEGSDDMPAHLKVAYLAQAYVFR